MLRLIFTIQYIVSLSKTENVSGSNRQSHCYSQAESVSVTKIAYVQEIQIPLPAPLNIDFPRLQGDVLVVRMHTRVSIKTVGTLNCFKLKEGCGNMLREAGG